MPGLGQAGPVDTGFLQYNR